VTPASPTRRSPRLLCLLPVLALLLPSCAEDGNFTILGYTTAPNYDMNIHTVRVPIFKNLTMRDSTREGIEFQLTQEVVRQIELKTPYKVVGADCDADTELEGTITAFTKNVINRNQLNEVREAETTLTVEIYWRDLRTGEVLSQPKRKLPPLPPLGDAPPNPPKPGPAVVSSVASFVPEVGQSITTARQDNIQRLAVQIVGMMEKPW
jgi:hypothetical protein